MTVEWILLLSCLLVATAVCSVRLAQHWGAPAMLLFVGLGMLAGSSGPGGIAFSDYSLSYNVGLGALAMIVFAGGFETDLREFKAALLPAGLLATVGVAIKAGLVACALALTGFLSWPEALLLGAILAPTDAAAVFSVLKGRGLRPRLAGILEAESGTNDPISIYLTLALTTYATTGALDVGATLGGVVVQLLLGTVYGVAGGWALRWWINRVLPQDAPGLYPLFALTGGLGVYAAAVLLQGNGFLAAFIAGIVMGRGHLSYRKHVAHVLDTAAWLAQVVVFLMLGLLVFPDKLPAVLPGALLASAAVLVARPLAVALALAPSQLTPGARFDLKELTLLSWGGLKGAVPIILAIVPLLKGHPQGELLFNMAFVVVLLTTTTQGISLIPLARRLGLLTPPSAPPSFALDIEGAAPANRRILAHHIEREHWVADRALNTLQLHEDVAVVAVVRGAQIIAPRGGVTLHHHDHIFVLLPAHLEAPVRAWLERGPQAEGS